MRILFMGTPDFALPSLKRLIADGHEIVGVCCQPDKPQGRHFTLTSPPAKKLAQEYGIPVFQPKTLGCCEAQEELFALKPDLIVVAAFGKILPKAILDLPPKGCINVHGSILPKYRGAAPIQWAVINDDVTAGVTIMQMAEGLDTGDMLLVKTLTVGEHETAGELFDRIAELGAEALSEAVKNLDSITPVPQNEAEATWAPMLKKTDGEIDGITFTDPETLIRESDYISFHCPLTDETRGMVNAEFIAKMKDGAVIVNTSRGAVLNEADVAAALHSGKLSGAGLDVLAKEPADPANPLLTAPNTVITPHCAWTSKEARLRLMDILDRNLGSFLTSGQGINRVF